MRQEPNRQIKLRRREVHRTSVHERDPAGGIDFDLADTKPPLTRDSFSLSADTAQNSVYPRHKLSRRKRFDDVIVGPNPQPNKHVGLVTASGQHHDRDTPSRLDSPTHLDSIETGKHQIENDEIGSQPFAGLHGRGSVVRNIDSKSLRSEPCGDGFGDGCLIVDHKNRSGDFIGAHNHTLRIGSGGFAAELRRIHEDRRTNANMEAMSSTTNRSLVLGGGGLVGIAWLVGVASGLADGGIDLIGDQAPDTIVGTSAGSIVGALLARRQPLGELRELSLDNETAKTAQEALSEIDLMALVEGFDLWAKLEDNQPASLVPVGQFASKAKTIDEASFLKSFSETTIGGSWPSDGYRCAAVDVDTGALRAFASTDGVELSRAVAASCSVPGIFPPITVGTSRYTDGGLRSGTNADLVTGSTTVLILAPMGSVKNDPLDVASKRLLDAEVAALEAAGSLVTVMLPDDETNTATMISPLARMEPTARQPALDHGIRQGRALAGLLKNW